MIKLLTALPLSVIFCLTGCAATDWTAINQRISDTAENLSQTLYGATSSSSVTDGSMPVMVPKQSKSMAGQPVSQSFTVPVDVDTAAARLKRYYQFISTQELESLRNSSYDGAWKAAAVESANPVWEAMPGSYYKMGSDWNDEDPNHPDHLDIEVEKSGTGSILYITYRSASAQRLAGSGVQKLMNDIHAVAIGKKR